MSAAPLPDEKPTDWQRALVAEHDAGFREGREEGLREGYSTGCADTRTERPAVVDVLVVLRKVHQSGALVGALAVEVEQCLRFADALDVEPA